MTKGEINFAIRPDYNQESTDATSVVPEIDYKFSFDHSQGLQLSIQEIDYHFNKWLLSLGYERKGSSQ
tara:strand:- start:913 stop:1116 length:204 start_codon:yes stop_codon:yes gene_type:complete